MTRHYKGKPRLPASERSRELQLMQEASMHVAGVGRSDIPKGTLIAAVHSCCLGHSRNLIFVCHSCSVSGYRFEATS